jgi:hypothetical protein
MEPISASIIAVLGLASAIVPGLLNKSKVAKQPELVDIVLANRSVISEKESNNALWIVGFLLVIALLYVIASK